MKLYISGPMSGYHDMNAAQFEFAAAELSVAGFDSANPHNNGLPQGLPPSDYMRADIKMMMDCDGVATIGSWRESWGACIEVDLAHRLLIPVRPLEQWVLIGRTAAAA